MVTEGLTKGGGQMCVFFAQHLNEKQHPGLWEGPFFIAPKALSANVGVRRRGASPCRAVRLTDCTKCYAQVLAIKIGMIAWCEKFVRPAGSQGEVPSVPVALGGYGTLSR